VFDSDDPPKPVAGRRSLARVFPFLDWWPRVTRQTARADIIAGLSGAMLGLPQGVAFAILAGLPPEYGLYAAMIPPALAALFGSSFHMVAGPTNAVAILLFASLAPIAPAGTPEYIRLVLTVTFLTGVFELAMGIARLGALVNFISHTVLISQVSVPQPSALALLSLGMLWAVASRIRGRCAGRTGARRR